MKKNTVVYDFVRFSVPVLVTFTEHVVECMTGNEHFPMAASLLSEVAQENDVMKVHHQASLRGNREESALTRQAKERLLKLLKKTANIVDDVADGDEAIIISSGFHLAKQPEATTRALITAESGDKPGSVILRRQADPAAKSYLWEKSLDGKLWEFAGVSGTTRHEILNLKDATRYYFRVAVVTSEGTLAFSEAISKVIE